MSTQQQERAVPLDTFGHRLMLARAHAGHLTIREAAERTGLGRGAWQNWERGTPPQNQAAIVMLIADELGVDRDWLMWGGPLNAGQNPHPPSPDPEVTHKSPRGKSPAVAAFRRKRREPRVPVGMGTESGEQDAA